MTKDEFYLRKALEEAEAAHADAARKVALLQNALQGLLTSNDQSSDNAREDDGAAAIQGAKGLEIMLNHMPDTGLTAEELIALLEKHGVGDGKKRGMVRVSIDTNLSPRAGNLEVRDKRYYLTEKAKRKAGRI